MSVRVYALMSCRASQTSCCHASCTYTHRSAAQVTPRHPGSHNSSPWTSLQSLQSGYKQLPHTQEGNSKMAAQVPVVAAAVSKVKAEAQLATVALVVQAAAAVAAAGGCGGRRYPLPSPTGRAGTQG
jgi:hypothetical protein